MSNANKSEGIGYTFSTLELSGGGGDLAILKNSKLVIYFSIFQYLFI
jgi:hypothetical protein